MTTQTVHGLEELIDRLDRAVQGADAKRVTREVKDTLEEMLTSGTLELPPALVEPRPDRYARRLLHKSDELGYSVLAMTWGPGQATPLHDHAGMWCVEGVLCGNIDVTQYELLEQQGDRYRFRRQNTISAGVGNAGALIPPFEYHTIANTSPTAKAVTVHVYAGEMTSCTIFVPGLAESGGDDGWHEREERQLSYCE
ncbi:MAG TPA: cysteine dioxygenase family protein [Thermoanaerobaculia bacterium]|jgi:predicted metal-dependent enzyme (double-stranded beta helix superfamily)|nr:cysteine dioxygenase family protein [Thermoanaerobaculia bacterium]